MKKSNRGESLLETLISMFIIALGMAILSASIAFSARLNAQANSRSELVFANLERLSPEPPPETPEEETPSVKVNGASGFWPLPDEFSLDVDDVVNLYTIESGGSNEMYFYVFP